MIAISFTGLARSGKDTAADYLVENCGFEKLVMSDELAEELAKAGKEDTKMNRSHMGTELRKKFGDDIVARRVFEKAGKRGLEKAIFVGPRSVSEIDFFEKNIEHFYLVAVTSKVSTRFERRTEVDGQTREKFMERDEHDKTQFELAEVIARANHLIENNSNIEDFHKKIDSLMQKIGC